MEYLHITECTYLIFSITYWEYSVTTQFSNSKRCLLYLVNTSGFSYKLETTAKLDSQVQLNILSAICLLFIYVRLSCLIICLSIIVEDHKTMVPKQYTYPAVCEYWKVQENIGIYTNVINVKVPICSKCCRQCSFNKYLLILRKQSFMSVNVDTGLHVFVKIQNVQRKTEANTIQRI